MAFVPVNQDDEEKRRAAAGGAPGSFGDTTPVASTTQPKFVNVADYLSKNQEGSAQIGEAASNKLAQQRDEASGAVTESGNKFSQDVSSGTTNLDQGLLDNALSNPEQFTKDPNNTAKFLAMRDASYKGPASMQSTSEFAPADTKVKALGTTASSLGTEEGRNALVQGLSAHPTTGKTSLNQLLLQGNPDAATKIQATAGTFKSVEDQWNDILAKAPASVDAARAATDAARTTTQGKLGQATDTFKTGINAKLATANSDRDAFNLNFKGVNDKLNGSASGADLTQQELDQLGLKDAFPFLSKLNSFNTDLDRWGNPVPLSGYVNAGSARTALPTLGGVANADDYAREAALQQLSGNDLGLPDSPETPYVPNGKMPTVDYKGAFDQAGTRLQGYEKDITTHPENFYPLADGVPTDDFYSKYYPAAGHVQTPGYYTDPAANATPNAGYQISPPPAGWDTTQPAPYPSPTSAVPPGMVNAQWNPYTGQWEGPRLAPENTPPSSGGGRHAF